MWNARQAFAFGNRRSDVAAKAVMGTTIREVDIDLIDEHPDNRAVDEAHVAELADSIKRNGLGQLPMVRVSPDDPDRFQHISGWHRILAYERLFDETHDPKYAQIKVNVAQDIDDETVRSLVYETNYHALSVADRGRWFQSMADEVARSRETDESLKGVPTADAVAAMASERLSENVSPSIVKRGLKAYRDQVASESDDVSADVSADVPDAPGENEAPRHVADDGAPADPAPDPGSDPAADPGADAEAARAKEVHAAFDRAFRRFSKAADDILEMAGDLTGSDAHRAQTRASAFSEAMRAARRRNADG